MYRSFITLLCLGVLAAGGAAAPDKPKDGGKNKPAANGPQKTARKAAGPSRRDRLGPRGMWAGRRGRRGRLTKEQEAELLKVLKEKRPNRYKRVMALRDRDERRYHRTMFYMWWRWYVRWRDKPPAVQKAMITHEKERLRQYKLRRNIQRADTPQGKKRLTGQLRQAIRKAFEARQVIKEHRLTELEKDIQRIRAELKDRAGRKEQLVSERLEKLLANPPRHRRKRGRRGPRRSTTRPAA
ncbi:MAG: hypothetical protein QF577_10560 [Phycisphaerae bacterium]|nr:hypothetical protein [Phycisphaerae bacterium]